MSIDTSIDGVSKFRIKRPLITTTGFVSDVDATVKGQLDQLNNLLGKCIFRRLPPGETYSEKLEADREFRIDDDDTDGTIVIPEIRELLSRPLTPKRVPGQTWAADSLALAFSEAEEKQSYLNLSEYMDLTSSLSSLKYAFQNDLSESWNSLDFNTKAVLNNYPAIQDYLIAYAYYVMDLKDLTTLKNFILSNRAGAQSIKTYAAVSAARTIINDEQLNVPKYNEDNSLVVNTIANARLSLSAASFAKSLQSLIEDFVHNKSWSDMIDSAKIGSIPAEIKPQLVKLLKASKVPITASNIKYFLPMFLSQVQGVTPLNELPSEEDVEQSDKDFDVDFIEDDTTMIQISKTAVKCASQLYYVMVLGDEMGVFDCVKYLTHKYLIHNAVEIQSAELRDAIQLYTFSDKHINLRTGKVEENTRRSERKLFQGQVFGKEDARHTGDVIINREFPRLWKVLMLESARYLEKAQASPNPDNFVSRQNVMQATEDVGHCLARACRGIVNAFTPMIYAELDFVIRRILMHPEVLQMIVPSERTWYRAIETLYEQMNHRRMRADMRYNQAKLGYDIMNRIAEYNPSTFENDANFSAFISDVDAFITTQSIIQDSLTDDIKRADHEQDNDTDNDNAYGAPSKLNLQTAPDTSNAPTIAPASRANGSKASEAEWDF